MPSFHAHQMRRLDLIRAARAGDRRAAIRLRREFSEQPPEPDAQPKGREMAFNKSWGEMGPIPEGLGERVRQKLEAEDLSRGRAVEQIVHPEIDGKTLGVNTLTSLVKGTGKLLGEYAVVAIENWLGDEERKPPSALTPDPPAEEPVPAPEDHHAAPVEDITVYTEEDPLVFRTKFATEVTELVTGIPVSQREWAMRYLSLMLG